MNTNQQLDSALDQYAASAKATSNLKTSAKRCGRLALCATTLLGAAFALPAGATTILLSTSSGYIANVDTTTGAVSNAYQIGYFSNKWFDIAENDAGGIYTLRFDYPYTSLYSIDPAAPSATRIGSNGVGLNGLTFGSSGMLFATGGGSLYTIDTGTGAAAAVGSGIGGSFASSGDLTYAGGNSFFATSSIRCGGYGDCLWKIDATTGSGTQIGSTGYYAVGGLAKIGDTLYGLDLNNHVLSIDQTTGDATLLASYSSSAISGFTYGAAAPPSAAVTSPLAVPEPGALGIFGCGLLGLTIALRRKQSRL